MSIEETIRSLKHDSSLLPPPIPLEAEGVDPMMFRCSFSDKGAVENDINVLFTHCPPDLKEFWLLSQWAKLFEDVTYGQWGLEVLAPAAASEMTESFKRQRLEDYRDGDIIAGRFMGDSDLLLVRADNLSEDFGSVSIVNPIDHREDWYHAGTSVRNFLDRFVEAKGDKYWEQPQSES